MHRPPPDPAMEFNPPPKPPAPLPGQPRTATREDIDALKRRLPLVKSLAGAASLFDSSCIGGDAYANNCAHFLSDALIRAGYSELESQNGDACIAARCNTPAKRPIRARDMWCWFQSMKTSSQTTLPNGKGFWAVFQLDETVYWGGHVVIIDTDNNIAYGTGNYPDWTQNCYQW